MFTGIIEEVGQVKALKRGAKSIILTVGAVTIMDDLKLGDSVATNGVCLTVTALGKDSFQADVMHETMNRSSLGGLKPGSHVNLERAMPANGRFGGHMVSGHIDGTGHITAIEKDDNAVWYTISADERILRYIIEKGSIAIDGISLTVAKVTEHDFSVSIIPHTLKETILAEKRIGDIVNLENDMVGKYIEKFMTHASENEKPQKGKIDMAFLAGNGFI